MRASILESVKDYCLVPQETTVFDGNLCEKINSAFFVLFELGCSKVPFTISDSTAEWTDFTNNPIVLSVLPDYIQQKAKLGFDPPSNSFLVNQMKEDIKELESRISYAVDPGWEVEE